VLATAQGFIEMIASSVSYLSGGRGRPGRSRASSARSLGSRVS
jgi:hypothetical protein